MTLFEQIKADQLRFRKLAVGGSQTAKVYASVFTALLGESQIDGKAPSDDHLIKVIQKFVKNLNETLKIRPEDENTKIELKALKAFLPTAITKEQILEVVAGNEDLNKGAKIGLVKVFCAENGLLFDGKLVSSLI